MTTRDDRKQVSAQPGSVWLVLFWWLVTSAAVLGLGFVYAWRVGIY